MNKYQTLYDIFSRFPNASYEECLKEISGLTKPYYNKHKSLYKKAVRKEEEREKRKKGKKSKKHGEGHIPPLGKTVKNKRAIEDRKNPSPTFIDDPNDLLLSICIRELNRSQPDVRWANILLSIQDKTGKLDIKTNTEKEAINKLRKMPMETLLSLRKGLTHS